MAPAARSRSGPVVLAAVLALAVGGCAASPREPAIPSEAAGGGSPGVPSALATVAPTCTAPGSGGSSAADAWWADRVFYEAFVRSVADSDGDGIGDLRGLTGRLDALNDGDPSTDDDLGVTGLWLMPVMESPSYHGYDVTDYRAINPDYGSLEDFRELVDAAHRRGIAVVIDLPINHTSSRHPWFLASESGDPDKADWYRWSEQPPLGSGWHQAGDRSYYGVFGEDLPDLNLENPEVTAAVTDVARFWLEEMGVDGLRLDAAKHLIEEDAATENTPATHAWLRSFASAVHAHTPDALLIGEVWDLSEVSASYVPAELDMTFDFGLAQATVDSLRAGTASRLASALADVATFEQPDGFGSFLTNHDQDRIASELRGNEASLELAAGLLLTGPGTPFIYYGEEIGLTGRKPDERIRTPMPWDSSSPAAGFSAGTPWEPLEEGWQTRNVAAERADPSSLLHTYSELIRLREAHPGLRRGTVVPVGSSSDGVTAVLRVDPAETLLVVANLSDEPVADYELDLGSGSLCGELTAGMVRGAGVPVAPIVTVVGGFDGYRPLPELAPQSVSVVSLAP